MRIILTTCSPDQADSIGMTLVREGLVACVNVIPGVRAHYIWEGELCSEEEVMLMMETGADETDAAIARLTVLHGYDVPKIVVLEPEQVNDSYLAWVRGRTRS